MKKGFFLAFESAPKSGKTTLINLLADEIKKTDNKRLLDVSRSALSKSGFAEEVKSKKINDIGYSTAFYWADVIFDTQDRILPVLQSGGIVLKDRYDLSLVTYRESNNFNYDYLLLEEYIKRGMVIDPNFTVLLRPDKDIVVNRIKNNSDSSAIDKEFLDNPDKILTIQARTEYHLKKFQRQYIILDTGVLTQEECINAIINQIRLMGGI